MEALELFGPEVGGSLSGPGDFQLAALVMLTLSSSTVRSFHSIWLICCSSSSWSLIHWASSLYFTSCSSMFCQNFFTSPMSSSSSSSSSSPPPSSNCSLVLIRCFVFFIAFLSFCDLIKGNKGSSHAINHNIQQ